MYAPLKRQEQHSGSGLLLAEISQVHCYRITPNVRAEKKFIYDATQELNRRNLDGELSVVVVVQRDTRYPSVKGALITGTGPATTECGSERFQLVRAGDHECMLDEILPT